MRKKTIIIASAFAFVATAFVSHEAKSSPAATQTWVKNYVATNTVASASTTNAVIRAERQMASVSATVMQILDMGGTNAVKNAADAAVNAARPIVNSILEEAIR